MERTYTSKAGLLIKDKMESVKPLKNRDYELIEGAEKVIEKIIDMAGITSVPR